MAVKSALYHMSNFHPCMINLHVKRQTKHVFNIQ